MIQYTRQKSKGSAPHDPNSDNTEKTCDTNFKEGDPVEWNSRNGTTSGTVEKELTAEMQIKGHTVKASPENPEYLVKSDKTGAEAAHKPDALRKI